MRTEAYVERLINTASDPKAKPEKLVRMIEGFHAKLAASEPGRQALEVINEKIAAKQVRKIFRGVQ